MPASAALTNRLEVALADKDTAAALLTQVYTTPSFSGAVTVSGDLTIADTKNIITGTTTGTKIGTTTSQKIGFYNTTPVVQPAALTAQLTTLSPADAEGTPDYAIAALTSTTPFGFAAAQEGITVLYVIKNLQVRLAEVEARLEALGLVAAN